MCLHKQVTGLTFLDWESGLQFRSWLCQGQKCDKTAFSRRLAKVHRVMTGPFYQSCQAHTLLPGIDKNFICQFVKFTPPALFSIKETWTRLSKPEIGLFQYCFHMQLQSKGNTPVFWGLILVNNFVLPKTLISGNSSDTVWHRRFIMFIKHTKFVAEGVILDDLLKVFSFQIQLSLK